jgi:hypothetical protein
MFQWTKNLRKLVLLKYLKLPLKILQSFPQNSKFPTLLLRQKILLLTKQVMQ